VEVHCPSCQQVINIPEQYLGMGMQCPLCSASFMAPAPAVAKPPTAVQVPLPKPLPAPPTKAVPETKTKPAEILNPVIAKPEAPPRKARQVPLEEWFAVGAFFGGVKRDIKPLERLTLFAVVVGFCCLSHLLLPFSLGPWIGFSSWPQTVGFSLAFAIILWKINTTHKAADNWSFAAAGLGLLIVFMNLVGIVFSFEEETKIDWDYFLGWLQETTADGQLAFFLSGLLLGGRILAKGLSRSIPRFAYLQYLTFGIGLMTLSNPTISLEEIPFLGLLAWALFLVINNWFVIEDTLVMTRQPIKNTYFLRICLYNLLLILFAFLIGWHNQFKHFSGILFYLALVFFLLAWAVTTAWLYRHGKPQFSPNVQKIMDRIFIDMFPSFLIKKKNPKG
jgi:hypothetical protein